MTEGQKEAAKTAAAAATGASIGAGIYGTIGGVGVVAAGTGVGITLGPFIAIGAGVGTAAYGVYWLGKQVGGKVRNNKDSEGTASPKPNADGPEGDGSDGAAAIPPPA